jgi:hypothetical protein
MRHPTTTIERHDLPSQEPPTGDNAASDARAWLQRHIRWELRLAELRAKHERVHT